MDVTKYPDRNKLIKEEFILTHALKEQLWWWKSQDGRKVKMVEYEAMGHVVSTLRKWRQRIWGLGLLSPFYSA